MNLQIAHIYAFEDDGPRPDPQMSIADRNAYDNLMLMCVPHHTTIDQNEEKYTDEVLHDWKHQRENDGLEALEGLTGLTERRLEQMISDALRLREDHIDQALQRLEQIDASAARWMADLRAEVEGLRRRPIVDTETVLALERAAYGLRRLDEGVVNELANAAYGLRRLDEGVVKTLASAVNGLRGIEPLTASLHEAVKEARQPPPWM